MALFISRFRSRSGLAKAAVVTAVLTMVTLLPSAAGQGHGPDRPPQAGPAEVLPLENVEPGMQATAWTAFVGTTPEPIPVEVIGVLRNTWGPGQHIILAKLGGKAARTNVAGGMSGSPVYHDGKLLGAVSLRFSTFSPDAVAGITPIDLMLEINEFDAGRPIETKIAGDSKGAAGRFPGSGGADAGCGNARARRTGLECVYGRTSGGLLHDADRDAIDFLRHGARSGGCVRRVLPRVGGSRDAGRSRGRLGRLFTSRRRRYSESGRACCGCTDLR